MERTDKDGEIKQLYVEMYERLMVYANSVLGSYELAEEAVQETFRIACSKPDDLLASQNPKGWLMNTMKNVLRNMMRSFNSLATSVEFDESTMDGRCDEVGVDILYSDLSEDKDFQLLKKVILEQKTTLEVANELGISAAACAKRVQRAKKSLREKL